MIKCLNFKIKNKNYKNKQNRKAQIIFKSKINYNHYLYVSLVLKISS